MDPSDLPCDRASPRTVFRATTPSGRSRFLALARFAQRYAGAPPRAFLAGAGAITVLTGCAHVVEIRSLEHTESWAIAPVLVVVAGLLAGAIVLVGAAHLVNRRRITSKGNGQWKGEVNLLRSVLANLSEGVIVADGAGKPLLRNPAAEHLLGNEQVDLSPAQWAQLFAVREPEGYTPHAPQNLPLIRAMRGEVVTSEELLLQPPTALTPLWLSVSGAPLRDEAGTHRGGIATFRDITTQKRVELILRRKSVYLELLQEITVRIADAESLEAAAEATLHLVCRRLGWALGHMYRVVHAPSVELQPTTTWYVGTGEGTSFREATLAHRSGPGVGVAGRVVARAAAEWVSDLAAEPRFTRAAAARDCGLVCGVWVPVVTQERIVAVLEVFDRRRRSPDRELLDVLQQAVAQLGRVVERQQARAEQRKSEERAQHAQRMDAVGQLAGGVAHDFNNLLTVILGETQLALLTAEPGHAFWDTFEAIRAAGERAATLTNHLLAFSRRQILAPSVFDLHTLVEDLSRVLRRLIGEDIAFHTRLVAEERTVRADRGQIEQVLTNLVVNARDAMPGGGRLTVGSHNAKVLDARQTGLGPGDYVVLTVRDTGVGMTAEVRQRLFEPFFTTKDRGRGTGLGLATSFGIVKQSGGCLRVASSPGHGTTMEVYLPLVHEPAGAPPVAPKAGLTRGTETVMVVEDDADALRVTTRILERLGYRVLIPPTPSAALEWLRDDPQDIDLLITDVVMPQMDGVTLARRGHRLRPQLAVLYVTGYSEDAIDGKNLPRRVGGVLQKPYTIEEFARRVRDALETTPETPPPVVSS